MSLFNNVYNYEVLEEGQYKNGVWVDGASVISTFSGSVQPMSSREIESLNVGRRDVGKVKAFTNTDLPVSREGGTQRGALIHFGTNKYEVIEKNIYESGLINHYKYIAELVGEI